MSNQIYSKLEPYGVEPLKLYNNESKRKMNEHDAIENELERLGLDPKFRGRYWHIHCPFHDDRNKSAVCFNDGWICCFAGCPRRHINSLAGSEICSKYSEIAVSGAEQADADWTDLWLSNSFSIASCSFIFLLLSLL